MGSTGVPGWPFAMSLVLIAVVDCVEVEVEVVVRGSGTCLSKTWIESTTGSRPIPNPNRIARAGEISACCGPQHHSISFQPRPRSPSSSQPQCHPIWFPPRYQCHSRSPRSRLLPALVLVLILLALVPSSTSLWSHPPNFRPRYRCRLILFDLISSFPLLSQFRYHSRLILDLILPSSHPPRSHLTLINRNGETQPTNPKNKNQERNRDSHRSTNLLNDSCPLLLIKSCKPLSSDSRREVRSCPGRGSAFTSPSLSPSFGLNLISSDVRD